MLGMKHIEDHSTYDAALAAIAEQRHGVFCRPDLDALRVPPPLRKERERTDRWVPLAPGVWRHAGTPETWMLQLAAGLAWLGPRAAIGLEAAAALLDLDDFAPTPVQFVVPREARGRRRGPWTVHSTRELLPTDVRRVDGLRVTNVTRTLIDLAATGIGPQRLGDAIDQAIRRRLTSLPTLRRRIGQLRRQGWTGVRLLDELLLDGGGHSHLERRFLRLVRTAGLPQPRCQVVHQRDGRTVARVDFEWTVASVVVEVNGCRGHSSEAERAKDARRRNTLQHEGFAVLEFTTSQVIGDPAYVVATLREHLDPAHTVLGTRP